MANVGFVDAGERAPNGARLDLLTTGTQTAVEAGVSERGPGAQLQRRVAARPDPGRTRQEPGHTDHRGLPAGAARRVDGHLRDRAHDALPIEPEEAKRAAYAVLALLTAHAG